MTVFEEAIAFAVSRHEGMTRKSGRMPYILHPMEAAVIAGTMTDDEEVLAAAVLHDTVEDTATAPEEIERLFGARVAALVASETENKHPELTREESWQIRKAESLEKLKNAADPGVRILWLSDKLSNMRSFHRAWRVRGSALWADYHQSDPARQAWYYRSIDRLLEDLRDFPAWQEYHALVETIFAEVP